MGTNENVSKKQQVGKIISYVMNVISVIIMVFSVFIVITYLASKDRGYPSYFNRAYCSVLSDSMKQDYGVDGADQKWDQFSKGDVIVFKVLGSADKENLAVGTVVTFWDNNITTTKVLNTHRIYDAQDVDGDGVLEYSTKGDNNLTYDKNQVNEQIWREAEDIQGIYVGKAHGVVKVLMFMQSKTGFAVLIVVPCVLIMIYCGVLVILNLVKYTKQKAVMQHEDNVEALREQMKAELLKEMEDKKKQENGASDEEAKKDEEPKEEKADSTDDGNKSE